MPSSADVWYTSREDVKAALDINETARNNAAVDRAIGSGARAVEGLTHRRFYPEQVTLTFDWPNPDSRTAFRLWLNQHELITLDSITSGGVTIDTADVLLEPANSGPPFTHIELDRDSSASFGQGATFQRDISLTGLRGFRDDEITVATLAAAIGNTTSTTVDVDDSSGIGVGHILRVNSERVIVQARAMLDTTDTLQDAMTAASSDDTVPVSDGTGFAVGEIVLVDSERMLIVEIAGNDLIVKRAWDGSVLAAHTTGATVFASRRLTVERGALGTTAATHSLNDQVFRHDPPALVRDLNVAEAISQLQQEGAGWARTAGSGDNEREVQARGIRDLRDQVRTRYGRKARTRAV